MHATPLGVAARPGLADDDVRLWEFGKRCGLAGRTSTGDVTRFDRLLGARYLAIGKYQRLRSVRPNCAMILRRLPSPRISSRARETAWFRSTSSLDRA